MKCQRCGVELIEGSEKNLCYSCRQKRMKTFQKVGIIGAIGFVAVGLAYGLSPIDLVPDFVPMGFVDDIIVGALGSMGAIGAAVLAIYNGAKSKNIDKEK